MNQQQIMTQCRHWGQRGLTTYHGRLMLASWLAGLIYAPIWLYDIIIGTLNGAASLLLVSALALGFYQLWTHRQELTQFQASSEDRGG